MIHLTARMIQLKQKMRTQWDRLSDEELDSVTGDVRKLKDVLKSRYQLSDAEAAQEAQRFSDAFDNSPALEHEKWEDRGARKTHEQHHPEEEMIRKDKDQGRYSETPDQRG